MTSSDWLQTQKQDIDAAIETLIKFNNDVPTFLPKDYNGTPSDVVDATRKLITISSRLQVHLTGPDDFLQRLAQQSQLLASVKWLGDHQILAAVPLRGSVLVKDVADLAGVTETQLRRIVRMTATAGFLQENSDGSIAHTNLSASFVTNLSLADAITFLAETSTPTALRMVADGAADHAIDTGRDSAYCIAFGTSRSFRKACSERPRLQRQWYAYQKHLGDVNESIAVLLSQLNWTMLGNASVVEACARSSAGAIDLTERYPNLQVIVQITEPLLERDGLEAATSMNDAARGRVTVQSRVPGAAQTVKHAAVYIVRVGLCSAKTRSYIISELRAHFNVLRTNGSATLILAPPLLPAPGLVDSEVEAKARVRDLCHSQLNNEWALELEDLVELIDSVCDTRGKLVVVNRVQSENRVTVALGLKYKTFVEDLFL
ncbi:hypothetical protein BDV96DRAFT_610737 [Lophiotrema nucula]|uniref:Uncharacterized protein n=1 Tax=Lophiotrema nucula TaxID=690887 RepID=A0A6A5ZKQ1_9PLEO|nr:hypothetical protein BDV96DRAFT_610737 [Lophiotrema nucula]